MAFFGVVCVLRFFAISSIFLTIASAFAVYAITYDTIVVERQVHALERRIAKTRRDIAVLKAEYAHLARPERIAPAARALGLRPVRRDQFEDPKQVVVREQVP